ncbi:hypothetical protein [Pleionea sp. CnH1-48]|uniref:hypothetical protein n=1 Tax=Pleionea sp. CnH1-48 TaxID=2954494 RepID=UPI0020976745|nr:hypothetical protein [Pleionea sp. CnH1-48]MCO7223428.1 hypothetical protein [Pleionea sp. CnH1-48]
MSTTIETLSEQSFLTQFENQTLDPVHFDHLGHLRLAWLYLNDYDLETATHKVCTGIKAYAESLGAHQKFHLTITHSLVQIMASRMSQTTDTNWTSFVEQNSDLVNDALSILMRHFSKEYLFSDQARTTLVTPDIKPYR